MIIDIVTYYLGGKGGAETTLTLLSNSLKKKGHTVRILMAYPPLFKKWLNALDNVYYYGLGATINNESYLEFSTNYKKILSLIGKPDICIAFYDCIQNYICYYALEENNILSVPLVSFLHDSIKNFYSKESLGFSLAHFALNKEIELDIKNLLGNKRIYSIQNLINTDNISNINLSEKNLEILYIGRLESEKNIPYLLNSLSKLDNNFLLKIIGDGSLLASLKQQALDLKISEKISWTNWQENPWTKVSEASILILPSNEDKCPLVLLESLAHGIPVICTNSKIKNKFITHGKNGWFIDSNDENSLVNLLKDIINNKIFKNSTSIETEFEIIYDKNQEDPVIYSSDNNIFKCSVSTKWIEENLDYNTLLNNFIYIFSFFDMQMRLSLVSYLSEIGSSERHILLEDSYNYYCKNK